MFSPRGFVLECTLGDVTEDGWWVGWSCFGFGGVVFWCLDVPIVLFGLCNAQECFC